MLVECGPVPPRAALRNQAGSRRLARNSRALPGLRRKPTLWLKTEARPVPAVAGEETRGVTERALPPHKTRRQLVKADAAATKKVHFTGVATIKAKLKLMPIALEKYVQG